MDKNQNWRVFTEDEKNERETNWHQTDLLDWNEYTCLEHRFVNGNRSSRSKMEFVRLMPMVHDTEIDTVNSIFSAAAAAVAMQTVYFCKKHIDEPK